MRDRVILAAAVALAWLAWPGSGLADDWGWPEPTSYRSRGFGYVAEVFPPRSRQNPADKAMCFFYAMGYPGREEWKIDARLVWKGALVNAGEYRMPYEAIVSMDGVLVTLNDYAKVGEANVVVIYDAGGKLVKSYALDALVPKDDVKKFDWGLSGRWWNADAKYYFLGDPARLYVVLKWGNAMEFMLKDGAFNYGALADFPDLAAVMKNPHANEQAEVWATSLRFSSITDVLEARKQK